MIEWSVSFTNQAELDLREIYTYIAMTLLMPNTATNFIRRIIEGTSKLSMMPLSYAIYPEEPWMSRGLRHVHIGNYIVFFIPVERSHTVVVIRIIYCGRDIQQVLEETIDLEE